MIAAGGIVGLAEWIIDGKHVLWALFYPKVFSAPRYFNDLVLAEHKYDKRMSNDEDYNIEEDEDYEEGEKVELLRKNVQPEKQQNMTSLDDYFSQLSVDEKGKTLIFFMNIFR